MFKLFSKSQKVAKASQPVHAPSVDELFGEAFALHQSGQIAQAIGFYQQVLQLSPGHFDAQHLLGVAALQSGHAMRALELLEKAIAIKSDYADAYLNKSAAQMGLQQFSEAVASCDQAIAIEPENASAHSNRGNALRELKQYKAALASCQCAIALQPNYAEAHLNHGAVLHELQQYDAAVASYDRALAINPGYADAYSNRGNALQKLQQTEMAIASFKRAIEIRPNFAEAHHNLACALLAGQQLEAAIVSGNVAVTLRPDYAEAYYNLGLAQQGLGQNKAAVASYDKALALQADHADAWNNRGVALQDLRNLQEAVYSFDRALALAPQYEFLYGSRLYAKAQLCDHFKFSQELNELEQRIERGEKAAVPFATVALTNSLRLQQTVAQLWTQSKYPSNDSLGTIAKRGARQKIRLGYFSADFHNHPVSFLMAELFEIHDRDRFEVYAFSFGSATEDAMRLRLMDAFDEFVEIGHKTDEAAAALARKLEIDIAIDLGGHTKNSRLGIFAYRAAPIQVNYLGFPGTTGAPYMDYLVADPIVIPEAMCHFFNEKIVYMPGSYMVNDSTKVIADKNYARSELGLPEHGFVFCCFNNHYKISPQIFEVWVRILHAVEGSVLWLSQGDPDAVRNLRASARKLGVAETRIIFAKTMPTVADHLARLRRADLFLDTLPYNAHTTASDALWAGVPVLTCLGETFPGRVAASLLTAVGAPELIASSLSAYEDKAIELARMPESVQSLRNKVWANRLTTELFDTRRFAAALESAYRSMMSRYQADQAPDTIRIDRI